MGEVFIGKSYPMELIVPVIDCARPFHSVEVGDSLQEKVASFYHSIYFDSFFNFYSYDEELAAYMEENDWLDEEEEEVF